MRMRRILCLLAVFSWGLGGGVRAGGGTGTVMWDHRPLWHVRAAAGGIPAAERAQVIESRLQRLAREGRLTAADIYPALLQGQAVVADGPWLLATADPATAQAQGRTPDALARRWADDLRAALGQGPWPGDLRRMARLEDPGEEPRPVAEVGYVFSGLSSWYGHEFSGNRTADGEVFDPSRFTCASPWLPFNTRLLVTDLRTGRSVLVRVNDRGPFVPGRILDLSHGAAEAIGLTGVDPVRVAVLSVNMGG